MYIHSTSTLKTLSESKDGASIANTSRQYVTSQQRHAASFGLAQPSAVIARLLTRVKERRDQIVIVQYITQWEKNEKIQNLACYIYSLVYCKIINSIATTTFVVFSTGNSHPVVNVTLKDSASGEPKNSQLLLLLNMSRRVNTLPFKSIHWLIG